MSGLFREKIKMKSIEEQIREIEEELICINTRLLSIKTYEARAKERKQK